MHEIDDDCEPLHAAVSAKSTFCTASLNGEYAKFIAIKKRFGQGRKVRSKDCARIILRDSISNTARRKGLASLWHFYTSVFAGIPIEEKLSAVIFFGACWLFLDWRSRDDYGLVLERKRMNALALFEMLTTSLASTAHTFNLLLDTVALRRSALR